MAQLWLVSKSHDEQAIDLYREALQRFIERHDRLPPIVAELKKRSGRARTTGLHLEWLWLYADGLRRILPTPENAGTSVALVPMVVSSIRALLDTALSLQYYGIDEVTADEATFRRMHFYCVFEACEEVIQANLKSWNADAQASKIKTPTPTPFTDEMVKTAFFKELSRGDKQNVLKRFGRDTRAVVANRLGLSSGRYWTLQNLTSQFVHFLPYAMFRIGHVNSRPGGFAWELASFLNEGGDILGLAADGAASVLASATA